MPCFCACCSAAAQRLRFFRHYSREGYGSIRNDGCLKSWARQKKEGLTREERPVGARLLGDPLEYENSIAFSFGGAAPERVVASRHSCPSMRRKSPPTAVWFGTASIGR